LTGGKEKFTEESQDKNGKRRRHGEEGDRKVYGEKKIEY